MELLTSAFRLQWRTLKLVVLLAGLSVMKGCTQFKHFEYAPFVRELDGLSELEISTYPADYPTLLGGTGGPVERYETARELYFQVHIRNAKTKFGTNRHVRSITIHRFSYQIVDAPPVVLLSGYQGNFWMQNNPQYEKRELPAVTYVPGGKVSIQISFTLNGKEFAFEGEMPATEKSQVLPRAMVNQSI